MRRSGGQTDSQRNSRINQLKDIQYFKQNFKGTNDFQMKEILQNFIHRTIVKNLDHQQYIYFPQSNMDGYEPGIPIDESINQLNKKTGVIRMSRRIDKILRIAMKLEIPVLDKLKHHQKFQLLNLTSLYQYQFNRPIIQSFDEFKGIFYIIEGSVRIQDRKKGKDVKNLLAGQFIGLRELYQGKKYYTQSVYSSFNKTKVIFLSQQALSFTFFDEESTIKDAFKDYYMSKKTICDDPSKKIQNKLRLKPVNRQVNINKNIKIAQFSKKYEQFSSKTTIQDKGFNQYIRKKKILLKLKQSMYLYKEKKGGPKNFPYSALVKNRKNKKKQNYDGQNCLQKSENGEKDGKISDFKIRNNLSVMLKKKLEFMEVQKQLQEENFNISKEGFRVTSRL